MKQQGYSQLKLRRSLFWDVDAKKLNSDRDAEFIIGRVLDFGNLKEWETVKNSYSQLRIKKAARNHIFSDARSVNFWSMILEISLRHLRCATKPSLKTPKAFLRS